MCSVSETRSDRKFQPLEANRHTMLRTALPALLLLVRWWSLLRDAAASPSAAAASISMRTWQGRSLLSGKNLG